MDAAVVRDCLSLGLEATRTGRVITAVVCDAANCGRGDVPFEVGCPSDGGDLHRDVLRRFWESSENKSKGNIRSNLVFVGRL
jgi:hypothetical protein